MKLTNREKIILPAALLIIIAALFINFVYLPMDKDIKNLKIQSQDLENQIQDEEMKQKLIVTLQSQIDEANEKLLNSNKDILKVWDQAELLVFVENIIDKYSQKKSIDFFDVVTVDVVQKGEISLVVKTSYDDLLKLLKAFETADYYNNITSLSVKKVAEGMDDTKESSKLLEATMTIRFYSQNLNNKYPEKYDFTIGNYGKENIFE
jgi:uncharacterized membrane-anchored protein YjiN (DUF445 family)